MILLCVLGPQVLVLSPTRELAQQTQAVSQKFGSSCGISTVAVFGGASRVQQINLLRNKVDIVVATPGRMIDLLESGGKSKIPWYDFYFQKADLWLITGEIRNI